MCIDCKKPISNNEISVVVKDRVWHTNCFKCSQCQRHLAKNSTDDIIPCRQQHNGKIICEICYLRNETHGFKCDSCKTSITGKFREFSGSNKNMKKKINN